MELGAAAPLAAPAPAALVASAAAWRPCCLRDPRSLLLRHRPYLRRTRSTAWLSMLCRSMEAVWRGHMRRRCSQWTRSVRSAGQSGCLSVEPQQHRRVFVQDAYYPGWEGPRWMETGDGAGGFKQLAHFPQVRLAVSREDTLIPGQPLPAPPAGWRVASVSDLRALGMSSLSSSSAGVDGAAGDSYHPPSPHQTYYRGQCGWNYDTFESVARRYFLCLEWAHDSAGAVPRDHRASHATACGHPRMIGWGGLCVACSARGRTAAGGGAGWRPRCGRAAVSFRCGPAGRYSSLRRARLVRALVVESRGRSTDMCMVRAVGAQRESAEAAFWWARVRAEVDPSDKAWCHDKRWSCDTRPPRQGCLAELTSY